MMAAHYIDAVYDYGDYEVVAHERAECPVRVPDGVTLSAPLRDAWQDDPDLSRRANVAVGALRRATTYNDLLEVADRIDALQSIAAQIRHSVAVHRVSDAAADGREHLTRASLLALRGRALVPALTYADVLGGEG